MHWLQRKKSQLSAKSHFWENLRKSNQKHIFFLNEIILKVFVDLFRNGTVQRAQVFCVALTGILNFLKEGRRAGAFGASSKASGQKGWTSWHEDRSLSSS